MFKFKDVEITFDFKTLPQYDQEYLRTMSYEVATNRSVRHTGWSFEETYSDAGNFTLFNNIDSLREYMSEFAGQYEYVGSHLLHGKKYFIAWTFSKRNK